MDIIPDQRGIIADKVEVLPVEIQRIGLRRAIVAILTSFAADPKQSKLLTVRRIAATVFKVDLREMLVPCQRRGMMQIRWLAIALADKLTSSSLAEIGKAMGGRDHTTILNATRKMGSFVDEVLAEVRSK